MKKIFFGIIVFVVAGFVLQLNSAYALRVVVSNNYKTGVDVKVTRGSTQWKDIVWNAVDPFKYLNMLQGNSGNEWWKASIGSKKFSDYDDVGGDSNTINEILIKFSGEDSYTLIDPKIPGKVGATCIGIDVNPNGDLKVVWLDQRLVSKQLDDSTVIRIFDLPELLAEKTYLKDEKFSKYFVDKDNYNGALRVSDTVDPGDWKTLKELTSDHLGMATGVAKVKNNSKYYKVYLRGVDQDGKIKNYEWWQPGETKSFDFKGGLAKKVQCKQVWLAPKCQQNDKACNSAKAEKTPIGWGKWEQACSNIDFVEIKKSGGGAPDRLGLR